MITIRVTIHRNYSDQVQSTIRMRECSIHDIYRIGE